MGYDAYQGLALTMWAGFDLMPHNLWDRTPLYRTGFEAQLRGGRAYDASAGSAPSKRP